MSGKATPYSALPATAYWRTGVAEPGPWGLAGLWRSRWPLPADARFSTYGSCFAQHISRALVARQMAWIDAEPAPARMPDAVAKAFNYGIFSSRTANIYTARQLLMLTEMASGDMNPALPEIWTDKGRAFDSLRPTIEPNGFRSIEEAQLSRLSMVRAFRRSITNADVFIFTLGLTEGWENAETGQAYAICPGTVAGEFDARVHRFRNYGFVEIRSDLESAFALMRAINPDLRILLTVSPVPLTATASGQHVLVATTRSKSVLRAVAGEIVEADPNSDYFPSYEIITGAPTRAMFFEPNMRSVAPQGVEFVMRHFFAGLDLTAGARAGLAVRIDYNEAETRIEKEAAAEDVVCEEIALEAHNRA